MGESIIQLLLLLGVVFGPFALFTFCIHWLERIIETRLMERFGWKSVLWTGWIGTPIHELSHAAMCLLFRHKIKKLVLFEPDPYTGRLGYVMYHPTKKNSLYQNIGFFFIGIAPLIGGSLVLTLLVTILYPDSIRAAMAVAGESAKQSIESSEGGTNPNVISQTLAIVSAIFFEIVQVSNLLTVKFWLFIYGVLCVGSHMAPSPSDYEGAKKGLFFFASLVLGILLIVILFQSDVQVTIDAIVRFLSPLFAILVLTLILCSISTGTVFLITHFLPQKYSIKKR